MVNCIFFRFRTSTTVTFHSTRQMWFCRW